MIRFVIECHKRQYDPGIERRDYVTVDVELPELEALLKRGGHGEGGFESWRLLGAEILPANASCAAQNPAKESALNPATNAAAGFAADQQRVIGTKK